MSFLRRRAGASASTAVPDPEVRDFLRQRADEVGTDLPALGLTPRHWWGPWRAPQGPAAPLPAANGPFLWALVRGVWPVLLLAVLLTTVNYVTSALIPWAMGNLLDAGLDLGFGRHLLAPSLVFLAMVAVMAITNGINQMTEIGLWMGSAMGAARNVGHRVAHSGRAVKKEMPAGDVVTVLMTDADYVGGAFAWFPEIVAAIVSTAVVAVIMLRVSVPLGLLVLIGLPIVIALMTLLIRPLQAKQAVAREEQGKLTTISTDAVAGLRVLRGIGGEDVYNANYVAQSARVRDAGIRVASSSAMLSMLRSSAPLVFTALVVGYGALLTFDGRITVGQLVAFFGYTSFLRNPISVASNSIQQYTRAWVGVKKMTRVLGIEPLVDDSHVPGDPGRADRADEGGHPDWPEATLFDHRSGVAIHPHRMTALVSQDPDVTAAIARRLGRVEDTEDPTLEVDADGTDLRGVPVDEVRRAVFLSEAEAQLFAGSLREEVEGPDAAPRRARGVTELIHREVIEASTRREGILFRPEHGADDPQVRRALHVADAHDVVSSLQGGLDGELAEKGRNLSGGQRQRVALARAVHSEASVLVLVEPTSAVDSHTEARIAQRLAQERRGRTTVVVSASTLVLEHCDEVVLVSPEGTEITRGTHDSLRRAAEQGDGPALEYRAVVNREAGEQE
ncbi:ABC transporter ATP-binding protein [Actinomyces polynesiensis]|uniref:ABC transporter ATP-binding protein n=1 Tax=Actinomyces polynesiensis TaxID=1325934 RepID=UPI0009E24D01|nr:ABC transporter ATP-binding protein [Actinomyces polynesiensis]